MATKTWIVYKAESMSSHGWEERRLMPSGGLTDILWENWNSSGDLPELGDRTRQYENLDEPGNGVTHGKEGDWVVTRIHHFSSFDTDLRIVVCYCQYQPIEATWELLGQGAPVDELLSPVQP